MKNFFILLLLLPFLHVHAQEPGLKNVAGGQLNLLSLKGGQQSFGEIGVSGEEDQKSRLISLQPYMGWVASNQTLLGVRLGYQHEYTGTPSFSNVGDPVINKRYGTELSLAFFARYHLRPAARLGLFFQPSIGYSHNRIKEIYNGGNIESNIKRRELAGLVSPGIAFNVTERLGLLLRLGQVGYTIGKESYESESDRTYGHFYFNFNLTSFAWGVEYRWGGKEE